MIRFIRPTDDPEAVVARGLLYDHDKVIETGLRILAELSEGIRSQYGIDQLDVKLSDGNWATTLDEGVRGRIAELCREQKDRYDVSDFSVRVNAKPFVIRFYPYGPERLNRGPEGYVTSYGHRADQLCTAPSIVIAPAITFSGDMFASLEPLARELLTKEGPGLLPFPQKQGRRDAEEPVPDREWSFSDGEIAFLMLRVRPLQAAGLSCSLLGSIVTLAFDKEPFLVGERDLRIECTDL